MSQHDAVNHPKHYTSHPSGVECITITRHFGFNLGNVIKYLWRAEDKGAPIEDLRKARWYLDDEIKRREVAAAPSDDEALKTVMRAAWTAPGRAGAIAWDGGVCPVAPDTLVEAHFRDGSSCCKPARELVWAHSGQVDDIVAYHVIGDGNYSAHGETDTAKQSAARRAASQRRHRGYVPPSDTPGEMPLKLAAEISELLADGVATVWHGGDCPVKAAGKVQVWMRGGVDTFGEPDRFAWEHTGGLGDILVYRVLDPVPEGFTHWPGGPCPVPPDTRVDVLFVSGSLTSGRTAVPAGILRWEHTEKTGNIRAYKIVP